MVRFFLKNNKLSFKGLHFLLWLLNLLSLSLSLSLLRDNGQLRVEDSITCWEKMGLETSWFKLNQRSIFERKVCLKFCKQPTDWFRKWCMSLQFYSNTLTMYVDLFEQIDHLFFDKNKLNLNTYWPFTLVN